MTARRKQAVLLLLGITLAVTGLVSGDMSRVEEVTVYGNFDVTPKEGRSAIMYLSPGTTDLALEKRYRFDGPVKWHPIIALSILFLLVLAGLTFRNPELHQGGRRWLIQWLGFVGTRVGMLRVGQVVPVQRCTLGVLPVLNCETCEVANGACPIGVIQASMRHQNFPFLAVGMLVTYGILGGRWFCGWLCPLGMIEDLMDRISVDRFRLPRQLEWGRFVMLGLVFVLPLAMGLAGVVSWLPFCTTVCPAGKILGLAPYYLTTGMPEVSASWTHPLGNVQRTLWIAFHAFVLSGYLILALGTRGRFFCRYLCPLGAFLGLFNRASLLNIQHDSGACGSCTACDSVCRQGVGTRDDFLATTGCLRCGRCVRSCSRGNRRWTFFAREKEERVHEES